MQRATWQWKMLLAVAVVLLSAAPIFAAKPGGNQEALHEVLVLGADLHLGRQATYSVGTLTGYCRQMDNTWEWEIGSGITCENVQGISATGLLAAYERTDGVGYLDGAIAAGESLVARYDATTGRPYSQDVEFLVRLSADSGNPMYAIKAAAYYSRVMAEFTAVGNADRYIDARKSLAGWDLASQIRAAVAVGEMNYAKEMANRLLERRSDWEEISYGGWDYTMYSYASLLWAFHQLDDPGQAVAAAREEFREAVLLAQELDGSWEDGDYQLVAYAILGLDAVQGNVRAALGKAFAFLRDTQTEVGGWSYPPEYGEVNSEVLMALASLQQLDEGLELSDPLPGGPAKPSAYPMQ